MKSNNVSDVVNRLNFLCSKIYPSYNVVDNMTKTVDGLRDNYKSLSGDDDSSMFVIDGYKTCTDADMYLAVWDKMNNMRKRGYKRSEDQSMLDILLLRWIQNKVVYSFDDDVEASFHDMSWNDLKETSINILERLPLDCFAFSFNCELVVNKDCYDGCLVMNDVRYKLNQDRSLSRLKSSGLACILISSKELIMRPFSFLSIEPTPGFEMNFENLYEANSSEYGGDPNKVYRNVLVFILPYILYLCSENSEISQTEENKRVYRPFTLEPKHKYREVKQFICGRDTGIRIREFRKRQYTKHIGGVGSVKAPHVRRAHYHRYWKGSGADKHIEIRWMPPIYIHKDMKNYIKPVNARLKRKESVNE